MLDLLGDSERLERVWDSGSDHSAELAEIDAELVDRTSLIGTAAFRSGAPQRAELDRRIDALADRQAELSALAVKTAAGWTLKPTGEKFSDWWDQQDTEGRIVAPADGPQGDVREPCRCRGLACGHGGPSAV